MEYTTNPPRLTRAYYDRRKGSSWRVGQLLMDQAVARGDKAETARAARMMECSRWLEVSHGTGGEYSVVRTQVCKSRLCPWCAQRRSRRAYWTHHAIARAVEQLQPGTRWLLVTVTIRSVPLSALRTTIRTISSAWSAMLRPRALGESWPGYIRAIETTYSEETGLWHPHIHALVPVPPAYWGRMYVSQQRLTAAWAAALGVTYTPVCDVRPVHSDGGVAEVSKYAAKPLCVPPALLLDVDVALLGLRLFSYGGICRLAKRKLSAPDPDNAIDGTEDSLPPVPADATDWWLWDSRLQQYMDALPQAPPRPAGP